MFASLVSGLCPSLRSARLAMACSHTPAVIRYGLRPYANQTAMLIAIIAASQLVCGADTLQTPFFEHASHLTA